MGHRASYAVLENGELRLFYSHWGALTVPMDVFWGPGYTEAFIASLEEVDFWQDDVFGEGGIGLNKDERVMTYFGCDALAWGPVGELFDEIVTAWWAELGWSARKVEGTPDIAESVGQPRSVAEAVPFDPHPCDPETLGQSWAENHHVSTLLFVDGDTHRAIDTGPGPFLTAGPDVFEHLGRLPTLSEVLDHFHSRDLEEWETEHERKSPITNQLRAAIAIDRASKTIDVYAHWMNDHDLEFNRKNIWGGWTLTRHDDGLAGHFERLGVAAPPELLEPVWWGDEPEPVELTEADLLNQIHEELLGPRDDPTAFMAKVVADSMEDSEDVWVNPRAMVASGDPRPSAEECEAIFARAIKAFANSRKSPS